MTTQSEIKMQSINSAIPFSIDLRNYSDMAIMIIHIKLLFIYNTTSQKTLQAPSYKCTQNITIFCPRTMLLSVSFGNGVH